MEKHGMTNKNHPDHLLYLTWKGVKTRCYNFKYQRGRENYKIKGIKVYDKWLHDPVSFIDYIKSLPDYGKKDYSLDRINNDGNYEPGNLRWASDEIQATNKGIRKTNKSGYTGVNWCKKTGKWQAQIYYNKSIKKSIGSNYNTVEEAVQARNQFIIDNNLYHPIQVISSPNQYPQQ